MEEDIKIIEECKIMDDNIPHSEHSKRLRKAIENLIKGYRKLEGELNKLNAYILINGIDERLKTATQIEIENQSQYFHQKQVERLKERIEQLKKNSIPKSKIKEKIEKLEKRKKDLLQMPSDCGRSIALEDCDDKIGWYKELMEDK